MAKKADAVENGNLSAIKFFVEGGGILGDGLIHEFSGHKEIVMYAGSGLGNLCHCMIYIIARDGFHLHLIGRYDRIIPNWSAPLAVDRLGDLD